MEREYTLDFHLELGEGENTDFNFIKTTVPAHGGDRHAAYCAYREVRKALLRAPKGRRLGVPMLTRKDGRKIAEVVQPTWIEITHSLDELKEAREQIARLKRRLKVRSPRR